MNKHKDIYIFLISLVSVFIISVALIGSVKILKRIALKPLSEIAPEQNLLPQAQQEESEDEYSEDPLITPAWKIEK